MIETTSYEWGIIDNQLVIKNIKSSTLTDEELRAQEQLKRAAPEMLAMLERINAWCYTDEAAKQYPFGPEWFFDLGNLLVQVR